VHAASCSWGRLYTTRYLAAAITFDNSDVILGLQIHPELRTVAEVPSEPDRGVGTDRPAAIQDVGYAARWHADREREPVCTQTTNSELSLQKPSRVRNRSHELSFVIVDDLDVMCIPTMEFETDAPSRVHSHCPLTSAVTLQPMKPEAAERS
jgi:hypothetical protein